MHPAGAADQLDRRADVGRTDTFFQLPEFSQAVGVPVAVRVGINTGTVSAGLVGATAPKYDVYG